MRDYQSFKNIKHDRGIEVTAIALEMRRIVQRAAEPVHVGETVKAQQNRAWEALKASAVLAASRCLVRRSRMLGRGGD